jgi:hypothetical protein
MQIEIARDDDKVERLAQEIDRLLEGTNVGMAGIVARSIARRMLELGADPDAKQEALSWAHFDAGDMFVFAHETQQLCIRKGSGWVYLANPDMEQRIDNQGCDARRVKKLVAYV